MTFEQTISNEIDTIRNETANSGVLSDTHANRLFLLTSIAYNLRAIKAQDIQSGVASEMSEALNNIDMSKIDLSSIKDLFKN